MKITPILLKDISCDLKSNPLWGLARLNEYTNKESVLRLALLRKYNLEIEAFLSSELSKKITKKLLDGKLLNELTEVEQDFVKSISKKTFQSNRKYLVINKRISYHERKTILNRNCKIA